MARLRADALWLCPILIIHLCLTLPLAWKLNLWIDEASSLDTSGKSFLYALRQAFTYELQAPLYFGLLNLWRIPSESIFHARLFSVACTSLMLVLVVGIVRRYFPKLHPAWVVALLAVHPFTIWAATEIRVYALVMLLSAVLMRLFFDGFLAVAPQQHSRWGYFGIALLSLYTYYFLGFLLVAQGCALLVQRRWSELRVLVGGVLLVGAGIVERE
ncbi:MAG: glycosyltransferase family 39 protein [Blastocatellia bacterium]|nr:glycosyltransferase family 39 protein [Blastocatellia bacterium]